MVYTILNLAYPKKHMSFIRSIYSCYNLKLLELNKRSNSYIKVSIRELDKELCIRLSILYTNTYWFV